MQNSIVIPWISAAALLWCVDVASAEEAEVPLDVAPPSLVLPPQSATLPSLSASFDKEKQEDTGTSLKRTAAMGTAQLGIQYAVLYYSRPAGWNAMGNSLEPSWTKLQSNFERTPVWEPKEFGGGGTLGYLQADGDPWFTNVVGHGLQGSEIYLRMRQEGFEWWKAFAAGVVHSTVWEYAVEGWNETPSTWDLAYTPLGGMALGELRYQISDYIERRGRDDFFRLLGPVMDPLGALVDKVETLAASGKEIE